MRHLSRWVLTLNGRPLDVLSTDETAYNQARFFLYPPTGTIYENSTLSVLRKRMVGDGFHEDIAIMNHGLRPVDVELRLEAESDFADLFEVKDALAKEGRLYVTPRVDELVLGYRRDDFVRETHIRCSRSADFSEEAIVLRFRVDPHAEWSTCIDVAVVADQAPAVKYGHDDHLDDDRRN